MLTCPLCKNELATPAPRCPRCQTDVSLLSNFVGDLKTLLEKADTHRRAGELASAVQIYLAVLEIDPTNAEARSALGPVLLALRSVAPSRPFRPEAWLLAGAAIAAAAFAAGWWVHHLSS